MPKKETFFKKGHKGYYPGKHVPEAKFIEVWDQYRVRDIDEKEAARQLGVCHVTFEKWRDQVIENAFSLEGLVFIDENNLWKVKKGEQNECG